MYLNPLVADPLYLVCMAKNSIFKKEGIIEKNSYERCTFESVDDRIRATLRLYVENQRKR